MEKGVNWKRGTAVSKRALNAKEEVFLVVILHDVSFLKTKTKLFYLFLLNTKRCRVSLLLCYEGC